jgi:hypothetical protein
LGKVRAHVTPKPTSPVLLVQMHFGVPTYENKEAPTAAQISGPPVHHGSRVGLQAKYTMTTLYDSNTKTIHLVWVCRLELQALIDASARRLQK